MSRVYKITNCVDSANGIAFGGGGGGGGRGGSSMSDYSGSSYSSYTNSFGGDDNSSSYDSNGRRTVGNSKIYDQVQACKIDNSCASNNQPLDFNGNGSQIDEVGVIAGTALSIPVQSYKAAAGVLVSAGGYLLQ